MHIETLNLREVIVFLVAAGVVVPLIQRLRISPVLGFLAVGLAIGPHGLGRFADALPWLGYATITDLDGVRALAELGVVFLLFMIGLELSLDRLWSMRRLVFGLGGIQVVLTGAVIAAVAAWFDNPLPAALVLGGAFALSSTAIVVQLLAEHRRLGTATGRTSFAILLFQDLAVLPILFLVSAFAAQTDGAVALALASAIGQAAIAVAVILVVGRLIIRPLFRVIGSAASREMFLALVLLVIVGTALVTQRAGLSLTLGAFLAGLLLAETEYRYAVEVDIEPFKGLLLGLFFVSVGMSVDLSQVAAQPLLLCAAIFGLLVIKSPIIYGLVRLFGEPRSVALESALLLGPAGEFAFVVVGLAASLALLPAETAQFMLIVAGVTMLATPPLAYSARRLARLVEARDAAGSRAKADLPTGLTGHIIIVGYGRVGRMLSSLLDTQGLPYVALDSDAGLVRQLRGTGASVFFGDASRPALLQKFSAETAAALVITMDSPLAAERVVTAARKHWPHLAIYARARDIAHARRLLAQGASHAVPEATEASLQLSELVLIGAGIPDEASRHMVEARRQVEQAALDEGRRS